MHRTLHSLHLRRAALWVVMAALVLAQTLGLLHRVVHAPQASQSALSSHATAPHLAGPADASSAMPGHSPWLSHLFGDHKATGCDSYDQLSHADFLWGCVAAPTVKAVSAGAPTSHPGWQHAAHAAGYLARGPPKGF